MGAPVRRLVACARALLLSACLGSACSWGRSLWSRQSPEGPLSSWPAASREHQVGCQRCWPVGGLWSLRSAPRLLAEADLCGQVPAEREPGGSQAGHPEDAARQQVRPVHAPDDEGLHPDRRRASSRRSGRRAAGRKHLRAAAAMMRRRTEKHSKTSAMCATGATQARASRSRSAISVLPAQAITMGDAAPRIRGPQKGPKC